jgi:hypothetical protein
VVARVVGERVGVELTRLDGWMDDLVTNAEDWAWGGNNGIESCVRASVRVGRGRAERDSISPGEVGRSCLVRMLHVSNTIMQYKRCNITTTT